MTEQQAVVDSGFGKAITVGLLGLCVCLAFLYLLNNSANLDIASLLENPLFAPALILQLVATLLFVLAWRLLLRLPDGIHIGFKESASHIGVTLMGKYLPGKIWGLIGRNYLLTRRGLSNALAVNLLLADQFLTFYSGLAIACVALLLFLSTAMGVLALLLLLAITPFIIKSYGKIIHWLLEKSQFFLRRLSQQSEPRATAIAGSTLGISLATYLVHWVLTAIVLWLLYYPLLQFSPWLNMALVVAAIPLGVLTGFIAMWAPGGIGVREGVIVAILALNMPLDLAASIAISYRLLCVLNDLSTGVFALFYISRNFPGLLNKPGATS